MGRPSFWPIVVLGLTSCARLVGLDELREEQRRLEAADGMGRPDADARTAVTSSDGGANALPEPPLEPEPPLGPERPPPLEALNPVRLAVIKEGDGTIVSEPAGIACGSVCDTEFPAGTRVTLEALTENGSNSMFSFWSAESGCSTERRCVLPALDQGIQLYAYFRSPQNAIFASSVPVSPTLGGVQEYDRVCNALALRAGINGGAVGEYFLAVISDELNSLRDRLAPFLALFEQVDGSPFATTPFELFERDVVLRAVDLDEYGTFISDRRERRYLTGTLPDGSASPDNCNNWTDPSLTATAGIAAAGPGSWLAGDTVSCSEPQHLLCVSVRLNAQGFSLPQAGSRPRLWVSRARFVPGSTTPDEHCRQNAPDGLLNVRALISYTDRPARDALTLGSNLEHARPDGMVVGSAEEIVSLGTRSGIWQADDLTYLSPLRTGGSPDVWTGQTDLDRAGSIESTCNDWRGAAGAGITGRYDVHRRGFWGELDPATGSATRSVSCADPAGAHLYCVGDVF